MGKKTMVSIKGKDYKVVSGSKTKTIASSSTEQLTRLTFTNKIVAVLIDWSHNSASDKGVLYYMNSRSSFWSSNNVNLSDLGIVTIRPSYFKDDTAYVTVIKVDDYNIDICQYGGWSGRTSIYKYIAILEDDSVGGDPMYLLNGTILYTDGTVTSDVSGAIETLATNKYKIKTNAVVNITGATYIDISN